MQWDFPDGLVTKTPNAGNPGLISGQETRSNMPQVKGLHAARKIQDPACHN